MAADPAAILARYRRAKAQRSRWEPLWRDCYAHALPQRAEAAPGDRRGEDLFDGTAPDAVEQLAASLLAELTPPWSRWVGFAPGPDLGPDERQALGPLLEAMAATLQAQLDRSNFAVEVHQCYLDLAVGGTACLLVEEAAPGEPSALRFTAVPLGQAVLSEGAEGRLDTVYRRLEMAPAELFRRFPGAVLPREAAARVAEDPERPLPVVEAVEPDGSAWAYSAILDAEDGPAMLAEGRFGQSPFIAFRWLKAPGEAYGRSPVMTALPDIRTANKVVELILKNASIAAVGVWQAEDDGVLNPAAIRLVPGAIIPKAAGSAGLTPLEAPGKFDVSDLVLQDLRARIRHALYADRLAQIDAPRMTATEVLERAAEMARLLGATYGRLQGELLGPLVQRALAILRRRGEVPDLPVDGRAVTIEHLSPVAQAQAQRDVRAVLLWLDAARALGPEALAAVDLAAAARWIGRRFGAPAELIREPADG